MGWNYKVTMQRYEVVKVKWFSNKPSTFVWIGNQMSYQWNKATIERKRDDTTRKLLN